MPIAVLALGITQITAWGTSFYCLGVLAGPISQDTHWSRGFVFLGFTVALLVMGVVSSAVGRTIDRRGARVVMTLGSVLVAGLEDKSALVRGAAVWALSRLLPAAAFQQLAQSRARGEPDPDVRREWTALETAAAYGG
jgi:MFS family permease